MKLYKDNNQNNGSSYLVSRQTNPNDTIINVNGIEIGGKEIVIFAGPCAVESRKQLLETAKEVYSGGANILRGGAFKRRTSPYSFQGLGEEGLKYLSEARDETGLPVVTEVMDTRKMELVCKYTDIIQIGSRSMHNFPLLKEVGKCRKPVLFKRGLIYEDKRVNNWDPKLQTTIADSEIEYKELGSQFNYVQWKIKETGQDMIIGTTRPELICTCGMIIYHPDDKRYKKIEGLTAVSPIFNKEVKRLTLKIQKEYKPDKIIIFGSFVSGKITLDSDVDFFIINEVLVD